MHCVRALSLVTDLVSAKYLTDDGNFDVKQNSKQTFAFLFYLKKYKRFYLKKNVKPVQDFSVISFTGKVFGSKVHT